MHAIRTCNGNFCSNSMRSRFGSRWLALLLIVCAGPSAFASGPHSVAVPSEIIYPYADQGLGEDDGPKQAPDIEFDNVDITATRLPKIVTEHFTPITARSIPSGGAGSNSSPAQQNSSPAPFDNNSKPSCDNPAVGNPVIVATGEKIQTETDFVSGGFYGLNMVRTYRAFGTFEPPRVLRILGAPDFKME